ncbi:MAG: GNAT family N-acetyltransferase [Chloroflexia bacterium]
MQIREFMAEDYPTVRTLWERTGMLKAGPTDELPALEACAARNPGLFLVGVDPKSGVIATALAGFDGRRAYLYHVAVDPDYRRRGYARMLLEEIMPQIWTLGPDKIVLRVARENAGAITLYRSLGMSSNEAVIAMTIERPMR